MDKNFAAEDLLLRDILLRQMLMILSKNTHIQVPSKLQMKRKKVKTHLFLPGEIYKIEKIFSAIYNVKVRHLYRFIM